MFTGRNDINSGAKLAELLLLQSNGFGAMKADRFLSQVWEASEAIWQIIDEPFYTNHNLGHSVSVIRYSLDFDPLYHWSSYERLILGTAALIHDIGMQYNSWASNTQVDGFPLPPLESRQVRDLHTMLGFDLISAQLYKDPYPPAVRQFCDVDNSDSGTAMFHAKFVAFAHSGEKYRNRLVRDTHLFRASTQFGDNFRPRLLAGILRLCDELDGSKERILDFSRIDVWDVNDVSAAHWMACHFVEGITVKCDSKGEGASLHISWRIPERCSTELRDRIKVLLEKMRVAKISDEIRQLEKFFGDCREQQHIRPITVDLLDEQPNEFHFVPPRGRDVIETLNRALEPRMAPSSTLIVDPVANPKTGEAVHLVSDPLASTSESTEEVRLEDALNEWYENNRNIGHFKLLNGEHTDVYLNCRSLFADQRLLRAVARRLAEEHRGHNIDVILAVGTSAIPIATNVAFLLGCNVTFTITRRDPVKESDDDSNGSTLVERQDYTSSEINPAIGDGQNILIIDDVLSGGQVALDNMKLILEDLKRAPTSIYHHSIFRLGKRDFKRHDRIIYNYIIHKSDVDYTPPEKCPQECPQCQRNEFLIEESKMY